MSIAILACTGLDKPEGSVAREVAIRLAEETGAEIICPVVLNRTPARYKKALAENQLIVVDGCATQCASKLAAAAGEEAGPEGGGLRRSQESRPRPCARPPSRRWGSRGCSDHRRRSQGG